MSDISTLIGVLVDVSGSMKDSVDGGVDERVGAWIHSVFQVVDDLIKHDVSSSNQVFAVGVGASCGNGVFDLISTLDHLQNISSRSRHEESFDSTIDCALQILEDSGAHAIKKWAKKSLIERTVSSDMATLMLRKLQSDPDFVSAFVNDCLPAVCKGVPTLLKPPVLILSVVSSLPPDDALSRFRPAKEEDIIKVMEEAKAILLKDVSVQSSILSVQKASEIVHGYIDDEDEELTTERIQELMSTVDPFIYGRTPLFTSLEEAGKLFVAAEYRDHKKLLFVISDGEPTDYGNIKQLVSEFRNADVKVVSCFITRSTKVEPKRLHSIVDEKWEDGAKFLFALSSTIPTQLLPRTIFIKRGWKIDIKNNETKLFLHVNHPDVVKDACDLARNVVCCQDALSDILASVSLDIYINQEITGFRAKRQEGSTCYANASAAVLHLSMKRILGRDGGYPDFIKLRNDLITRYGKDGANTVSVLKTVCPLYRLRCQVVDIMGALRAVTAKRPVVARFRLTDEEWKAFLQFYIDNPTGILTTKVIDIRKRPPDIQTIGHAVVLTSYNSECLRLMNSWGTNWADMGFFRVQKADVIGLEFVDVFWTLNDLTNTEKAHYAKHGAEVAAKLINNLTGLQKTKYKCPLCSRRSLVTEFTGQLLRAICPKCRREFPSDKAGNILALNMYLTSLSR